MKADETGQGRGPATHPLIQDTRSTTGLKGPLLVGRMSRLT